MDFTVPADHNEKLKESEKRDKYLDLARELKKTLRHESDGDTNCQWCTWYCDRMIGTGTGRHGNKRRGRDHPNDSIIKIGYYTEESPGDLRKLAVTHTLEETHTS